MQLDRFAMKTALGYPLLDAEVEIVRGQRAKQRLGQQHHAGAATVRPVVDRVMAVVRPVARIPRRHLEQPALRAAAGSAEQE